MAYTTENTVILSDSKYTAPSLDAENILMYIATYKTEYGHSAVFSLSAAVAIYSHVSKHTWHLETQGNTSRETHRKVC